jgi:hypothetical protein
MNSLENKVQSSAQCTCGNVSFELVGKPLLRGYCHCTICQEFNQKDFADICLYLAKDVVMPAEETVEYKTYATPPMVYRGKCTSCEQPALEYISLPLMPKLVIVPTSNINNQSVLPSSLLHIFYHSRVRVIEDTLPKYEGYLKSQLVLLAGLIRGYFSR